MVMRVGGLASGMDIDSIVEKLMQVERSPLNKLQQQNLSGSVMHIHRCMMILSV